MIAPTNWKRNIAIFITGQGITLFGSSLVHYAVMWHITLTTQSGVMMTMMAIAGILPMFFISPFAGVWADRYNKKHIINISDAAIAAVTLVMAVIFSIGTDFTWLLLICLVARSTGQGIQMPAVNALIPELVPGEHLTRVNGINGSMQNLMLFASPMLGGALLAIAPIQTLMFIDVGTALVGISMLLFFVKIPARAANEGEKETGAKQFFDEISEGIRYIGKDSFLKKGIIASTLTNILVGPASILTPLYVARRWGDDLWSVFGSAFFGAEHRLASIEIGFSAGMMIGGLVIGIWGGFKNKNYTFALSTILVGITAAALGVPESFWVFLAYMGLCGIFLGIRSAPVMAMMQANIDSALRGRVLSVYMMVATLAMPLGMLIWGPLSDTVAIEWLLISTGIVLALLGVWTLFDKSFLKAGAVGRGIPDAPPP